MRRKVNIKTIEDLEKEINNIERAVELKTLGIWSVYQIFQHITEQLHNSMKGFPTYQPKLLRMTIGRYFLSKILKSGEMAAGYKNPYSPKNREEGNANNAIERLKETIRDFKTYDGEMSIHPIFDKLSKDQWTQLHLIHFSLHLSFIDYDISKLKPIEEIETNNLDDENIEPEEIKKEEVDIVLDQQNIIDNHENDIPEISKNENQAVSKKKPSTKKLSKKAIVKKKTVITKKNISKKKTILKKKGKK
jgi:hypothetical protein